MRSTNNIFLIDCIGQVVGREDPEDIVTNAGQSSKRMRLYLEDAGLLNLGKQATQPISHLQSQEQQFVTEEISSGEIPFHTIEDVYNMTEAYASCTGCYKKVISKNDYYQCGECGQRASKPPLRYRIRVVITDSTGCLNILLWNPEAVLIVGKSATDVRALSKNEKSCSYPKFFDVIIEKKYLFKIAVTLENMTSGDPFYSVSKISDDQNLIELYGSQSAMLEQIVDQSVENSHPVVVTVESSTDGSGGSTVSLSKDSPKGGNLEISLGSPAMSGKAKGQGSNGKTFKRVGGKRKHD
ncbi:hypothetical protein PIB30_095147 [Stylosanthes scabra]|uniref:Replication factor A C-terminal domain-containing protein n=1 Tax=Stylosanthes scabra TaxID=79078 RepID=A0ABU6TX32_9FABA|nr:hypothetical protein [Stylosanthes scabra]